MKLKDALGLEEASFRVVLSEVEGGATLADTLEGAETSTGIVLAIGPEGGWANDELKQFADAGWKAASLGPTILRAETAAISALAIASSAILE
jgi:16S rRNA (uracil1498-N3)-methyltransferase